MSNTICPCCSMDEILDLPGEFECMTCGHEWENEEDSEERVVKDAFGNVLSDGEVFQMIKGLKLKGTSKTLKSGMKSKPIRLVDGDHEISCKMDRIAMSSQKSGSR